MGSINFNNALGVHPDAMLLRAKRTEILANNLANSDTPGFKSRDMNFQAMLAQETQTGLAMSGTNSAHISGSASRNSDLLFRNPSQPSIDGNTVDTQIEQTIFTRNAMDYNSSFEFLSSRFKGLKSAIRGD
ncbi:MAG: flagellar basal body rod protein FlgB [Oleispira sp.]|nr:flagellar basal body rod protein FlgB [Oleispira sp.]MBL4881686.1 flagellar basal body rod protein FlgB [Oleispira sp.]